MSQLNYLKWRGGASSRQAFPLLKLEFHVAMLSLLRHITGEFDLEFVFLLPSLPNGHSAWLLPLVKEFKVQYGGMTPEAQHLGGRHRRISEFKSSLFYNIVSSKTARAM